MFLMTALDTVPTPFHAGLLNKRLPLISLGFPDRAGLGVTKTTKNEPNPAKAHAVFGAIGDEGDTGLG
jgi:hypothetical protein